MVDQRREALRRAVYENLPDPEFRSSFTAQTPDGQRPIVIALREDPIGHVLEQVSVAGGAVNVAVRLSNAIAVLAVTAGPAARAGDTSGPPTLARADCTVGVFLQRVLGDAPEGGAVTYSFPAQVSDGVARTTEARALFAGVG